MPSKYRAFKEAADRIVELERDLSARDAELAAMKQLAEDANRDIFWLYSHCRAIGMIKEADKATEWPRATVRDICMFTIDLKQRAEVAEERDTISRDALDYLHGLTPERVAQLRAAERELAAMKAENSKLRSALEIVHFKREPWQ